MKRERKDGWMQESKRIKREEERERESVTFPTC